MSIDDRQDLALDFSMNFSEIQWFKALR